ncbi:hypothetical protein Krac_6721 [Ktedonobacter racemifer DSM 44963]|uniref:Uncharacterized protein n=1 Tax=Ktedonobacter racemifer DSM 44963 TaxID=485913 RepID=D6TNW3_KTERA|nr:hypothetical protein Krac_6721 [Ktedonobacter racemifer DSM 44963]
MIHLESRILLVMGCRKKPVAFLRHPITSNILTSQAEVEGNVQDIEQGYQ